MLWHVCMLFLFFFFFFPPDDNSLVWWVEKSVALYNMMRASTYWKVCRYASCPTHSMQVPIFGSRSDQHCIAVMFMALLCSPRRIDSMPGQSERRVMFESRISHCKLGTWLAPT